MTKQSKFGSRCELSEKFLTEEGRRAQGAGMRRGQQMNRRKLVSFARWPAVAS